MLVISSICIPISLIGVCGLVRVLHADLMSPSENKFKRLYNLLKCALYFVDMGAERTLPFI